MKQQNKDVAADKFNVKNIKVAIEGLHIRGELEGEKIHLSLLMIICSLLILSLHNHISISTQMFNCKCSLNLLNIFEPTSLAAARAFYTCAAIMAFTSSNGDLKLE